MLNLVSENKHPEAHYEFTSNYHVKKLHFCYISKGCKTSHKPFWIRQYLYVHDMYKTKILQHNRNCRQKTWNNVQSTSFKISKMAYVSSSYFVKIKTFRWRISKLLGNRKKGHILEETCHRVYFGEVQEEVQS